jgi:mitochondrial import receptor subunit TOM40
MSFISAPPSGFDLPNNPGTVEDLHKSCQNVFPMYFEGAKVLINKGLSSHFQVSHTITMSSMQPSGYRFGKSRGSAIHVTLSCS